MFARFALIFLLTIFAFAQSASCAVKIDSREGAKLSIQDLHFTDDHGEQVALDRYFTAGKPVVLSLVYFGCPGVCTVLLNSFVETMTLLGLRPGRDFELVAISINPDEKPELASKKKESYLKLYGHPETRDGWHFLTGRPEAIAQVSRELGFEFERDPETGFFNHPSALFVLTPAGMLSSTLVGLRFPRDVVRQAILEASEGRLGRYLERLSSLCYTYLPHRGWLDRPERWFGVFAAFLLAIALGGWQLRRKVA
jgi:protein SCO1/2